MNKKQEIRIEILPETQKRAGDWFDVELKIDNSQTYRCKISINGIGTPTILSEHNYFEMEEVINIIKENVTTLNKFARNLINAKKFLAEFHTIESLQKTERTENYKLERKIKSAIRKK